LEALGLGGDDEFLMEEFGEDEVSENNEEEKKEDK
jgi:hypothetical protein